MNKRTFTEEEKTAIINDYTSGNGTLEILSKYHLTSHTLYALLDENHVPRRRGQSTTKNAGTAGLW